VLPGLVTAWNVGSGGFGDLYLASSSQPPAVIFAGLAGTGASLARGLGGDTHLVFYDNQKPHAVHYGWSQP
jgi:hypothetical protein